MQIFYHLPCGDRFQVSSSVRAICAAINMIDLFFKTFTSLSSFILVLSTNNHPITQSDVEKKPLRAKYSCCLNIPGLSLCVRVARLP